MVTGTILFIAGLVVGFVGESARRRRSEKKREVKTRALLDKTVDEMRGDREW